MTRKDILMKLATNELTPEQADELLTAQAKDVAAPAARRKETIKTTDGGGLFVSSPLFQCWSKRLQKNYQGGLNMDANVAKGLFADSPEAKELLARIVAHVKTM